eukprot:8843-Pelagomonas_calceolata.AAC.1
MLGAGASRLKRKKINSNRDCIASDAWSLLSISDTQQPCTCSRPSGSTTTSNNFQSVFRPGVAVATLSCILKLVMQQLDLRQALLCLTLTKFGILYLQTR